MVFEASLSFGKAQPMVEQESGSKQLVRREHTDQRQPHEVNTRPVLREQNSPQRLAADPLLPRDEHV